MSLETVAAATRWVRDSRLLGKHLEVLWHAGEPLLAGIGFYRDAHQIVRTELPESCSVEFAFQTNGTLIDDAWAEFLAEGECQVGISIDGPREWHDARRRTWGGGSSFEKVMRGVDCLTRRGVSFSTVTVLSRQALDNPKTLYDFLVELGSDSFGFNDEEREGIHVHSVQYASATARREARHFYEAMYDLADGDGRYDRVREISKSLEAMRHAARSHAKGSARFRLASETSDPFRIISVGFDGRFSTFAPELMGHWVEGIGEFFFGNVHDDSLSDVVDSERFNLARNRIDAGIEKCRLSCPYYAMCGGGSPSNKYFENGEMDSTETAFCQLSIMAPIDAVLSRLEHESIGRIGVDSDHQG